jgi:hypothetical protein
MEQLFDGSASRLVQRSLSAQPASKAEIEEIRAMLSAASARGRK